MKTQPNDPTSPCVTLNEKEDEIIRNSGLTKREIFAMTQMAALASRGEYGHSDAYGDADEAVRRADALIKALNKEEQ